MPEKRKYILSLHLLALLYSCNPTKQEAYYLPEKYSGPVVIFYNQKNATKPKTKNGIVSYYIPASGVLFVSSKGIYGIVKPTLFYTYERGKIVALPYAGNRHELSQNNGNFAFSYSSAEFTKEYGVTPVHYSIFLVGQRDVYDSLLRLKDRIDIEKSIKTKAIAYER
jgi:hypothetical protein